MTKDKEELEEPDSGGRQFLNAQVPEGQDLNLGLGEVGGGR
jgi:hypothetical protein